MSTQQHHVQDLMTPYWYPTLPLTIFVTICQFGSAYISLQMSWWMWILMTYVCGATVSHAVLVLLHDYGHHLCFSQPYRKWNIFLAIGCSLPLGLPISIPFTEFHRVHHQSLCLQWQDPDVPTDLEIKIFDGMGWFGKFLWLLFQPIIYSLRPSMIRLQIQQQGLLFINVLLVLSLHVGLYHYHLSWISAYLVLSTIWSQSLHPCGMHVVFEHYPISLTPNTRPQKYKTFSYYGWWNIFFLNLGMHREHHDYPTIPWFRLSEVRKRLPHRYPEDGSVQSLWTVFMRFVFDPHITLKNRATSFLK